MNIETEVKKIISDHFGVAENEIQSFSHFQDDLNADPLSVADLVVSLEDKFKLKIPQEEIIKLNTVQDVIEFLEDHVVE